MNMNKKKYIAPMMESNAMNMACDILTMSASKDLPGTSQGTQNPEDDGMDADANERVEWGSLW
jgi:hypothetical protein